MRESLRDDLGLVDAGNVLTVMVNAWFLLDGDPCIGFQFYAAEFGKETEFRTKAPLMNSAGWQWNYLAKTWRMARMSEFSPVASCPNSQTMTPPSSFSIASRVFR